MAETAELLVVVVVKGGLRRRGKGRGVDLGFGEEEK